MFNHHTKEEKMNGDNFIALTCIYDSESKAPATKLCSMCQAPLCSSCGYYDKEDNHYCNDWWYQKEEDETGICSRCGSQLEPIYENNGFIEPYGPSKYEIVGYKPCECRRD